jgi:hypothetical protein
LKATVAVKLIERAVEFYIQQNLEVAANLYQLGYNRGGYTEEQFKERERYREALELVRKELES